MPESEAPKLSRLSQLVDRLASDDALFTPLTAADDAPPALEGEPEADTASEAGTLFKVTGRGFVAGETEAELDEAEADLADLARLDGETEPDAPVAEPVKEAEAVEQLAREMTEQAPKPEADAEAVERVSRYNFDELSRILNDRVGEPAQAPKPPVEAPRSSGALINLGGETLVLNRLPLGILVFRDQQVLFANRAITEMVGYESVESLRTAGLAAVFPAAGPGEHDA